MTCCEDDELQTMVARKSDLKEKSKQGGGGLTPAEAKEP